MQFTQNPGAYASLHKHCREEVFFNCLRPTIFIVHSFAMLLDIKAITSVLATLSVASALIPIEVKGNRFIKPATKASDDGEVFFIKGADYQPGGSSAYTGNADDGDVLSDASVCYRDAYVLQQANINTIRIYTINPDVNHDECMSILNDAGIYVILDVNSALGGQSLNRDDPLSTYNGNYLSRVFKVIDAFKGYPNLLGLFSGNEVINDEKSAGAAPPYIRAVQRDMKQYIAKHANRTIPVGYSAADVTSLRKVSYDYLECDNNDQSHSDFFGLNSYEWCSGSSFSSSGYSDLNTTFANSSIPVFLSEYGCNTKTPRTFEEVSEGIFGGLLNTLSGGLVYEYAEEENQYGLVEIDSSSKGVTYKGDFDNFKKQLSNVTASFKESSVSNRTFPTCSSDTIKSDDSSFDSNFTLPSQPDDIKKLIDNGAGGSNVGKIVDVTAQTSNYTVTDSSGNKVSNPTVQFSGENEINAQDGTTPVVSSTTAASSSSSSSSASKSKGAAPVYDIPAYSVTGFVSVLLSLLI